MVKIIIPLLCKVNNNEYIYHKGMTKKKLKRNDDGERLIMYLLNLPVKESSEMSLKLAEACKVPLHTFRNWRGSRCRIPELAKDKIEEVTGVKIFHSENQ